MRKNFLTSVMIASMLSMSLNFIGANEVQAAKKKYKLTITFESILQEIPGYQTCDSLSNNFIRQHTDLGVGDRVTVKNSSGKTVAVGKFSIVVADDDTRNCILTSTIAKIPKSPYYDIVIGQKSIVEMFFEDLQEKNWVLNYMA